MAALLVLLSACSEEAKKPEFGTSVEATPRAAIVLSSPKACALDADCVAGTFCFQGGCARQCVEDADCGARHVCLERGRCALAESGGVEDGLGNVDVEPGVAIELPERFREVDAGQELYSLEVTVKPAPASGTLWYRIERTDGRGDPQLVRTSTGTDRFVLEIETGAANPSVAEPKTVEAYVVTSAGAFRLTFLPRLAVGGQYAGTVNLKQFGSTGLPIDFWVVTNPPKASLSQATEAYVVLPVGPEKLFSPHPKQLPADQQEVMTRPLTYDSFTRRWVAVFNSGFDLGETSIVSAGEIPGQVQRTLRFELEPFGAKGLIGKMNDRWTGLFDARTELGPREPATVVFEGELDLQRVGGAPELGEVTPPQVVSTGNPQVLAAPALTECTDAMLTATAPIGGYDCTGVTLAHFQQTPDSATAATRASCAIAVARQSLAGETTARQIASFLDDTNTSGESFADFMKRCAAGENGTCRPTREVLCARQLVASVYRSLEEDLPASADLVRAYQDTTREAFLGRQMGAFQTDAQTRLDWLKSSDYPAIVTSAVKELIAGLLQDWATNVLDVHLGVVAGQLDPSGLAVLSQPAIGEEATAARKTLLLEMTQSWRGASDALSLAATRWNELFQEANLRAEKAAFVSRRMFDLYLAAGMMVEFNRASGASFASGAFAGGFSQLSNRLGALSLPFDKLISARDAEVVVSTSVDPSSNNTTLLAERRAAALAEIDSAGTAVGAIIAESQAEALNQAELSNRMSNQINDVRSELVELCGLPVGCTADSYRTDPTCQVRAAPGKCGFLIQHESDEFLQFDAGQQSVSEAGSKLLALRAAGLSYNRAVEELRAHTASSALYLEATTAFANQVQSWNESRLAAIDQVNAAIAARNVDRQSALGSLLANIEERNAARRGAIDASRALVAGWASMRVSNIQTSFGMLQASNTLSWTAESLFAGSDLAIAWGDAVAEGFPKVMGPAAADGTSPARMSAKLAGMITASALTGAGMAVGLAADTLEVQGEKAQAIGEANLEALQEASEVEDQVTEADIAALEDQAELAAQQNKADEAALRELVASIERQVEADLAFQRDLSELNDRRTTYRQMLLDAVGFEKQVTQAELQIAVAIQEYQQTAQQAELRFARLQDLERQREEINSIVGSPTAVFAWANRLDQAERRLILAKDKLMNWLVALEYLAVRPFLDQRLQILLARNTYQLEAISEEIDRLQNGCGGPINRHVAELSLRNDLLDLSLSMTDPVTGESFTPAQRMRALLERGYVPIDKRVRYTSDSNIGGLLSSRSVLAATFSVNTNDFANLGASCNAKVYAIGVQLVGEGLGSAQPTVSILYDGASELRSCQPGLDDYLDTIGRDSTVYAGVTKLHAPGRSVSPVAGINVFPAGTGNVSLAGLPLASQYTVLIDPQMGENKKLDWSKLEDIKLQLEYTYQDLFPQGQCQ